MTASGSTRWTAASGDPRRVCSRRTSSGETGATTAAIVYAWNSQELPFRVFRVEIATGRREPWMTIMPQDPAGIWDTDLMITPDGKSYAYNCARLLADLYLVEGLK